MIIVLISKLLKASLFAPDQGAGGGQTIEAGRTSTGKMMIWQGKQQ